jgi:excisionase family DNA binding protein
VYPVQGVVTSADASVQTRAYGQRLGKHCAGNVFKTIADLLETAYKAGNVPPPGYGGSIRRGLRTYRLSEASLIQFDATRQCITPLLQGKRREVGVVPRLLSVREAAEVLSVSKATIYALCRRGEMPHLRVSNAIRIPALVLERAGTKQARLPREKPW